MKGQRPLKIICTYDNSSNDYANNNAKIIVVLIMIMNINTYTLEERGWTGEEQLVLNIKCLRKIKVFALLNCICIELYQRPFPAYLASMKARKKCGACHFLSIPHVVVF